MKSIIVTGPMASGKSTISRLIAEQYKTEVIDADKVVHDLYLKGSVTAQKIADHFGADVLDDNGVNREALSQHLNTEWDWKELESIVHPDVRAEINRRSEACKTKNVDYCIIELPALPRNVSWFDDVDIILICDAPRPELIERAKQRGLTKEQATRRLDRQLSSNELKGAAKDKAFIIDTTGELQGAKNQLAHIIG